MELPKAYDKIKFLLHCYIFYQIFYMLYKLQLHPRMIVFKKIFNFFSTFFSKIKIEKFF